MIDPKLSDLLHFLVIEYTNTVGRPKQTMPDDDLTEILKGLFLAEPMLKRMLEHMSCDFDYWRKLFEFPFTEFLLYLVQELNKYVK